MTYLIRILYKADARLIEADFEELDKLAHKSQHFMLEDKGSYRARAIEEEDNLGALLMTRCLNCAHAAWRQVSATADVSEAFIASEI